MTFRNHLILSAALLAILTGCSNRGQLVVSQGLGVTAALTSCPAVGIPDHTGDITLFRDEGAQTAADLDVTAAITNLRHTCDESGEKVYTGARFDVIASRRDVSGVRQVTLPYFATVLRAGGAVVSKQVGRVTLNFADGAARAQASGEAGAFVDRASATLPPEIREKITRRRRPGDIDAALDPLADPEVRSAIRRTSFELLIGFQLSEDQLAYNATR